MAQQYSIIANVIANTNSFTEQMNNVAQQTNSVAQNFATRTQAIGKGFTDAGKKMSLLSVPIVGIGVASAKMAIDFESQMSRVGAIAGATGGEMDALKKSAMELGADTSKSAGEVAVAMEEMAAMGFNAQEIMLAMPGIISASEASGESLALASQTVAAALNIWGLEASEASRVADVLAMAANASAAGIGDMQLAFKYAGAPAAALGIGMEDVAAAIGIMTNAGLDGSNAGTSLRASLLALNNPAKAQQKMMEQLGVSMRDSEGNALSLSEMVGNLIESTEHMTEADKVATLGKLVGTEAVSGFLALMKAGPTEIDNLSEALQNSAGVSAETAAIMKDNLGGSLEELGGSLETAAITIGNILIPHIQKAVEFIQELVEKFTDLPSKVQESILIFAGIVAAIGPVLLVVGTLLTSISAIVTAFTAVSGAITAAGGVIAVLTGPVGWVIAAIVALIAIGIALYKNWETIKEKATDIFSNFQPLFDTLKGAFQNFMDSLQPIWESLKTLFQSLMPILEIVGAAVGGVLVTQFGLAISIFSAVVSAIGPLINAIVNIADIVVNMVNVVVALLTGDFAGAWKYLEDIGQSTMDFFVNIFTAIVNFIGTFVKTIVDFFHGLYMTLVGNSIIPDMVRAIVKWFTDMVKWVVDLVKKIVTDVVKWFTDLSTNIKTIFTATQTLISTVWTAIFNTFKTIVTNILNTGKTLFTDLSNTVKTILTAISTAFTTIWNSISTTVSKVISSISTSISTTFNTILTTTQRIFDGVKTAITKPIETARDTVKKVVDSIVGFFTGMKLEIPEIKLPKLPSPKITGSFSFGPPPTVPSIKWNAKGGIFTKPTVLNTGAGLQGFGEVRNEHEAILPLNAKTFGGIGAGIAKALGGVLDQPQQQPVFAGDTIEVNIQIDKMTGSETDIKRLSKMITDDMKRNKGVRLR